MICKKPLAILIIFLNTSLVFGQRIFLDLRAGSASFRSETSADGLDFGELGVDAALLGALPLKNEQWQLTTEVVYTSIRGKRDLVNDVNIKIGEYNTNANHLFIGSGVRFIANPELRSYYGIKSSLLPYVGILAGAVTYENKSNAESAALLSGFTYSEAIFWEFTAQTEAGLIYMLSRNWGFGGYVVGRLGFSDFWDGMDGTTQYNDIIVRFGINATYNFN
jgi:hypothetical protein